MDSFKGSVGSAELGEAAKKGILAASSEIEVSVLPVSDGGEGLLEVFSSLDGSVSHVIYCHDPLGREIEAAYLVLDHKTAVIETATAAGLTLLRKEERNPLLTSSYGIGEMIRNALDRGIRDFIVGLGGSATNDAGLGMLRALGYRFFDQHRHEVVLAKDLQQIDAIDFAQVDERIKSCHFFIAGDVNNPLCGSRGASRVYAGQKGADEGMIVYLDQALLTFSVVVRQEFGLDHSDIPGTGAAGGLGFAFVSFLDAELGSGIELVLKKLEIEKKIQEADIIITGEGRVDGQSSMGKVITGIASLCQKYRKQCIVIAGDTEAFDPVLYDRGVTAVFSIQDSPRSLEQMMDKETTLMLVTKLSEQLFRVIY